MTLQETHSISEPLTWPQRTARAVLQQHRIPRHVAIIMDGNRRFGRAAGLSLSESYEMGCKKLHAAIGWCSELGVAELSVYAFSVENFKRSPEEVRFLFHIFEREARSMLNRIEELNKSGIRISYLGHLTYMPAHLQKIAAQLAEATKQNNKFQLNFCIAYTSRVELSDAATSIRESIKTSDDQQKSDINEKLIDELLYTHGRSVDLYVRTSGEHRLSDYYLWQSSHTAMVFVDIQWPQVSFWHLAGAIFYYQVNEGHIRKSAATYAGLLGLSKSCATEMVKEARAREIDYLDRAAKGAVAQIPLPPIEDN